VGVDTEYKRKRSQRRNVQTEKQQQFQQTVANGETTTR